MIDMSEFGYKHVTELRNATNVSRATWDKLLAKPQWYYHKLILLHPECPDDIRIRFATDPVWWKRLTAICAKHSKIRYLALQDSDTRVRATVRRRFFYLVGPLLSNLVITSKSTI